MQHRVLVAGVTGKMGREVVRAVAGEADMQVVGGVARRRAGEDVGTASGLSSLGVPIESDLAAAIDRCRPDVLVDFTSPDAVWKHAKLAAEASVRAVIGTSGLSDGELSELDGDFKARGIGAVVAPNFALGAVLMTYFSQVAAIHFPDAEIVEYHHDEKKDAPSGTALLTADRIAGARRGPVEVALGSPPSRPGPESGNANGTGPKPEQPAAARPDAATPPGRVSSPGARGADTSGIPVHSVRLPGFVAHQEVIFGSPGQTLSIRHDTTSRQSFMPGVIVSIRKVRELSGVVYGLESLLF